MLERNDYEREGADEDAELTYTFFHPDVPITLTEHELVNDYMRLRHEECKSLPLRWDGSRIQKLEEQIAQPDEGEV